MVIVRAEAAGDGGAVAAVNRAAFERPDETELVDRLRREAAPQVSLVGEADGEIVGHIFFSPVTIEQAPGDALWMGLAPMAVQPQRQRRGIGGTLVRAGLGACRALGAAGVVVLGHPRYYPRFGFAPAARFGLRCEYDVPDDTFMATELVPGALSRVAGLVRYGRAFADL